MTTPTPKLQWGDVTSIPRMMKAVVEGRGIEEGCQLERDLAAAKAENAKLKAENSKLRSALELVHFKQEPWQ